MSLPDVAPSRWNLVLGAVHDLLTATLTCPVSYGVPNDGDKVTDYVILGGISDDDDGSGGEFTQSYRTMAGTASWRDESGSINAQVWAFDGDHAAVRATTDRAFTTLDTIADALRGSIDLGDARTLRVEIESGQVRLGQTNAGAMCVIDIQISYTAVI